MTQHPILGLHHVTATVADAQEDLDFAAGALGLRLVKRTVNFDNHSVYHFYYGNETGTPGTVWTTFPYQDRGVAVGEQGLGQITLTSFSVPAGSLDLWRKRLNNRLSLRQQAPRFGEESLVVTDPSGLAIELVASDRDQREPWTANGVSAAIGVRGLHSVTLQSAAPGLTQRLMIELLGFSLVNQADRCVRLGVGGDQPGKVVDILESPPGTPPARNGLGTVHHVAFAIEDEAEQLRLREELVGYGLAVTEVLDRCYFRSIYFREPGGILFEVATIKPGFTVDEKLESLGSELKLPPWEERNRSAIEDVLRPVKLP